MEISTAKTISSDKLPSYWRFLQHSLVNYIGELFTFYTPDEPVGISEVDSRETTLQLFPNPAVNTVFLGEPMSMESVIYNAIGCEMLRVPAGQRAIDISTFPAGLYIIRCGAATAKIVKQ